MFFGVFSSDLGYLCSHPPPDSLSFLKLFRVLVCRSPTVVSGPLSTKFLPLGSNLKLWHCKQGIYLQISIWNRFHITLHIVSTWILLKQSSIIWTMN